MSTDKQDKSAAFRREIGAEFAFISDRKGRLTRMYGVKIFLVTFAKRYTFVIGKDRVVLHVDSGSDSIDPTGSIEACSLY